MAIFGYPNLTLGDLGTDVKPYTVGKVAVAVAIKISVLPIAVSNLDQNPMASG